jgi:hypothetical protein
VLVVMAVNTEVFPIAPICRVIEMVPVLMVDGEKVKVMGFEFPTALGANPAMKLEGFFPVVFTCFMFGPHFSDQFVNILRGFPSAGLNRSLGPTGLERAAHLQFLLHGPHLPCHGVFLSIAAIVDFYQG